MRQNELPCNLAPTKLQGGIKRRQFDPTEFRERFQRGRDTVGSKEAKLERIEGILDCIDGVCNTLEARLRRAKPDSSNFQRLWGRICALGKRSKILSEYKRRLELQDEPAPGDLPTPADRVHQERAKYQGEDLSEAYTERDFNQGKGGLRDKGYDGSTPYPGKSTKNKGV